MSRITAHEEGAFSFSDLATTDTAAARSFYTQLFGWTVDQQDLSTGGTYDLFQKDGKIVAAVYEQATEQQAAGIPPAWNTYFTVSDVDLATKEAEAAGGTIISQPFEVEDAGRMSVIADPAGAVFCLWQANKNIGAELMNEPNTLSWAECASTDRARARDFYLQAMPWTHEDMEMGSQGTYTVFKANGENTCGLYVQQEEGMPSSWLVYFRVADCEDSTKKARNLGGVVVVEPTMVPGIGTFSVILDPSGAAFGIIENEDN